MKKYLILICATVILSGCKTTEYVKMVVISKTTVSQDTNDTSQNCIYKVSTNNLYSNLKMQDVYYEVIACDCYSVKVGDVLFGEKELIAVGQLQYSEGIKNFYNIMTGVALPCFTISNPAMNAIQTNEMNKRKRLNKQTNR